MRQALQHMRNKKYGEAIDLLNIYISKYAQDAEGYNLRGLCHQRRLVYENALFDFRRARKLEPGNQEYARNEQRLRAEWNPILYDRIAGYKREIAINPKYPFNYLEIGKAYRWLEEWETAEYWYDEYLARDDDASPDEIIRYTLILIETGHIKKGEIILKKYVERYPDDWRLWSRYGYFTMWVGNYKNAERAFGNALSFKPFFKEALDGLDQAKKEPYVKVQHEGDLNYSEQPPREYPIDRYYRLIKRNPDNDDYRFSLIRELVPVNRLEEAYEQLKILKEEYEGTATFDELWKDVVSKRGEFINEQIEETIAQLKAEPSNRDAVLTSSNYYAMLEQYGQADEILSEYLDLVPNDLEALLNHARYSALNGDYEITQSAMTKIFEIDFNQPQLVDEVTNYLAIDFEYDTAIEIMNAYLANLSESEGKDIRYKLVKYHAWNYEWEDARDNIAILLEQEPNNLDYQLLAGQITTWTVDIEEFPTAERYFRNVLNADKRNLYALISIAYLKAWAQELPEAKKYLDLAKYYHGSDNNDIQTTENFYNAQVLAVQEMQYLKKREEAGRLMLDGNCEEAVDTLKVYFASTQTPDNYAYMELANAYLCLEKYDSARAVYDTLLANFYDFDIDRERAKTYLYSKDTATAITEFERLYNDNPDDFYTKMFLADSYMMDGRYGRAQNLYDELLMQTADDDERRNVQIRMNAIPAYGFDGVIGNLLPYNFRLIPTSNYYSDNKQLSYYNYGGKLEFSLARILGFGAGVDRTTIMSGDLTQATRSQRVTNMYWSMNAYLTRNLSLYGSMGRLEIQNEDYKTNYMVMARFEEYNMFGLTLRFENDDVRRILYSPRLITKRMQMDAYSLNAYYNLYNSLKFELFFRYNDISDGNKGNDFTLRLGKSFNGGMNAGYEYLFSRYKYSSNIYYSPQGFDAHSLWMNLKFYNSRKIDLSGGAKVGYSPSLDFIISDAYGLVKYYLLNNLSMDARVGVGNSSRFDSRYLFFSAFLSLNWNFL
ncbi:MAG: hypothetical protein JW995_00660 [Melioribacteraceae bacterium]|nr:hypothetical protein [Melioribacteraceae bacterium]